ncbi:sensor histidine kinase [Nonomuraea rosea]|uniref:sensor histidine kinase n=1 Tax=Nonomuraea rosea TaxID=638574 RepID=UPI0031E8EC71
MLAHPPRPPLLHRLPPYARGLLTWCAVAAFALLQLAALLSGSDDANPRALLLAGAAVVMTVPLAWARHRPVPVLTVLLAEVAAATALGAPAEQVWPLFLAAFVLVCGIAATRSGVAAALGTLVVVEGAWHADLWRHGYRALAPGFLALTALLAGGVLLAWLAGTALRQRHEYAEALRVHAVTSERLSIARDVHDMVAHSIGSIAIQAGAGSRVIDARPDQARDALDAIEVTSRETLKGLRQMLGVLRRPGTPSTGLADLGPVTSAAVAAGVQVDVRWQGERRPLPAAVDHSAFRIVQEAVTNVVRHADAARCRVSIGYARAELSVEIVDDGRGAGAGERHGDGHGEGHGEGHGDGAGEGKGYGIAGMRERVALLNGQFTAGPRPEGGFRVAARLPIP